MEGPRTAYEGDLIGYSLVVENTGTTSIESGEVLDKLPITLEFADAIPTPGGIYDPVSGIWTLPTLGTDENSKTAGLRIQAIVQADLIADPTEYVTSINMAEVISPVFPEMIQVEVRTNIVCAFCIDWEISSVDLGYEDDWDNDKYKSKFLFYVHVVNNGPVPSEAMVSNIYFNISGGGYGTVSLSPSEPVSVSLDINESQTITYSTGWIDGPDSDYELIWEFAVSDVALLDPILPNTASGSWKGDVEGSPGGGGGGCSISKQNTFDPLWLLLPMLFGLHHRENKLRMKCSIEPSMCVRSWEPRTEEIPGVTSRTRRLHRIQHSLGPRVATGAWGKLVRVKPGFVIDR